MDISALRLSQLRLVDALASGVSLTQAARKTGLTQSAASHALARLRKELRDPLFVPTSQGMRATPYGAELAGSVREALQILRSALSRNSVFDPSTSTRTFTVFMSSVGQIEYLPPLLERLAAEAPNVSLRAYTVPTDAPHLMLESGEVDLAVGTFTRLVAGCRQRRLFRERHVCVVRKDHPAFTKGMSVEAFRSVPHALAEQTGYIHEALYTWLKRQNLQRTVKLQVPYFLALPMAIARSDLLGIMGSRFARIYAGMLPLKVMPLPIALPAYDIKLFWHKRFHNEPGGRWLRNRFVELFGD
jgi:DNA-binding transcriptional LysR family regulator